MHNVQYLNIMLINRFKFVFYIHRIESETKRMFCTIHVTWRRICKLYYTNIKTRVTR